MINFDQFDISSLNSEFNEALEQFENFLLWVTDRKKIVNPESYELGWGNIILLVACIEKCKLIIKLSEEKRVNCIDNDAINKFLSLEKEWFKFYEEFKNQLALEVGEQFEKSIILKFENKLENIEILNEIHEFELFMNERDTIELFNIGSQLLINENQFAIRIRDFDLKLKSYIFNNVMPKFKNEYSLEVIESVSLKWLPKNFWWRHIN